MVGAYLETTHIPRVAGVLQTVLVAFQKELEEKPAIPTTVPLTSLIDRSASSR